MTERVCVLTIDVDGGVSHDRGELITGKVVVKDPPSDAEQLLVTLKGFGRTSWSEIRGGNTKFLSQTEDYVLLTTSMWTESAGGGGLQSGQEFRFSFQLPADLPPSLAAPHGHISYLVNATLKRGSLFRFDVKDDFNITIRPRPPCSPSDSALQPAVRSLTCADRQTVRNCCCPCWTLGTFSVEVTAPKRTYVAGESIPISAYIDNQSSVEIDETEGKLVQIVTHRAAGNTRETTATIASVTNHGSVAPFSVSTWDTVGLTVPAAESASSPEPDSAASAAGPSPLVPSDLGPRCKLFQVVHKLEFVVTPSGCHLPMFLTADLKLGPVRDEQQGRRQSRHDDAPAEGPSRSEFQMVLSGSSALPGYADASCQQADPYAFYGKPTWPAAAAANSG